MKLEDIKKCSVCNSGNLIPRYNIPIPDMFTEIDIYRDTLQCNDCDTLHYIDEGLVSYEFTAKLGQTLNKKVIR
jgi:hypothetical protein